MKLSDSLVLDARLAGKDLERSISGQVEFWARIGRAIEPLLQGVQVISLCRNAAVCPLSSLIESVNSPEGRQRLTAFLQAQPYPHYEAYPGHPGLLVKIDEDGSRTVGRFVNRRFVTVKVKTKTSRPAKRATHRISQAAAKAKAREKLKAKVAG